MTLKEHYRDLMAKSDDELYDIWLKGELPGMGDYDICLHILQLRHSERLIKKTWLLVIATWFLVIATVFGPYLLNYFGLG